MQGLSHMLWIMWTALTVYSLLAASEISADNRVKIPGFSPEAHLHPCHLGTRDSNTIFTVLRVMSIKCDASLGLFAATYRGTRPQVTLIAKCLHHFDAPEEAKTTTCICNTSSHVMKDGSRAASLYEHCFSASIKVGRFLYFFPASSASAAMLI
jgi:hypothetical protein